MTIIRLFTGDSNSFSSSTLHEMKTYGEMDMHGGLKIDNTAIGEIPSNLVPTLDEKV